MDIFSFSSQFQSVINFYLCGETTASLRLITMRRAGGKGGGDLKPLGREGVVLPALTPATALHSGVPASSSFYSKPTALALPCVRFHHTPRSLV